MSHKNTMKDTHRMWYKAHTEWQIRHRQILVGDTDRLSNKQKDNHTRHRQTVT